MRLASLTLGLVGLTALPALAAVEVTCTFETECFEAEACDAAAFEVKLGAGDGPREAVMRSVSETVSGSVSGEDTGTLVWQAQTPSTVQVLSWGADGTARYTLHLTDGPAVITYHGMCEAQ